MPGPIPDSPIDVIITMSQPRSDGEATLPSGRRSHARISGSSGLELRALGLLAGSFALTLGILTPLAHVVEGTGIVNAPALLLVAAPWVLALLIVLIAAGNTVRYSAAPLLLALIAPATIIVYGKILPYLGARTLIPSMPLAALAINTILVGSFMVFVSDMSPKRCPDCRSWGFIPVGTILGISLRSGSSRMCLSCGSKYWKTCEGEWRRERRRSWVEVEKESSGLGKGCGGRRFDVDSRVFSPRISNRVSPLAPPPAATAPKIG